MDELLGKMNNAQQPIAEAAPGYFSQFYDWLERFFDVLGLMRGTFAPLKRFIFGAGVGLIVTMAYKPDYAFSRGAIRPHVLLAGDNPVPSTWIPFWVPGLVTGICLMVFI